ncbi:nuclear transcription factor Y subunit C-10 [Raphanus sativus]|uniref:Nuclear transcription factor Y subunit C-10 n=1 Tax=Raphanus sativus TaxID=3726 RepID=A0A9W3DJS0_RAPSA|nr:nuclear transcription factor Y subunit C-10 [Raphanus sativus]
MKRSIVASSSQLPNASVKAFRIRMEPVAPYSHSMMELPYHTSTSNTEALSSLEAVLKVFWNNQWDQLQYSTGFTCCLPLSRVKKILKSDPKVRISRDAPALFSKACEYLILELTLRAWMHTQSCTRQTIQHCDVFHAVKNSETHYFLTDLVPFGPYCATHQRVLPPVKMILPDMNVAIDMNQIEQRRATDMKYLSISICELLYFDHRVF